MITKKFFSSSKHAAGLFNKLQYYLTNATMCQSAKQNASEFVNENTLRQEI